MGICRLRDILALDRDFLYDSLGDSTRESGTFLSNVGWLYGNQIDHEQKTPILY